MAAKLEFSEGAGGIQSLSSGRIPAQAPDPLYKYVSFVDATVTVALISLHRAGLLDVSNLYAVETRLEYAPLA
jgi:hypothetical protein